METIDVTDLKTHLEDEKSSVKVLKSFRSR